MSNDVADCGCEGHASNLEDCKYPRLKFLLRCFVVSKYMDCLLSTGAEAEMGCGCGHIFAVDAATGENMRLVTDGAGNRELVAQCPGCGLCDRRDWMDQ